MFDSVSTIKSLKDFLGGTFDRIFAEKFEITVVIDGLEFNYWTNCEITNPYDSISEFSISAPFDPENKTYRDIFRPFEYKEVIIYVNGEKELTGYFINPKPSLSANSNTITIDGFAKCGILTTVPADPLTWPCEIDGLDLEGVINTLCAPYGIKAEYEPDSVMAIDKTVNKFFTGAELVAPKPDQTLWDFLSQLAKQRGVMLGDAPSGNLQIRSYEKVDFTTKIDDSNAIISVTYNGNDMASDVFAVSNSMETTGGRFRSTNSFVKNIYKPMVYNAGDIATGELQAAADAEVSRNQGNAVDINVKWAGWETPDGVRFRSGSELSLRSPGNMLYNWHDYVIRNIKFVKTESEHYCEFDCVFDGAMSGKPETVEPWREPPLKPIADTVIKMLDDISRALDR